MSVGYILKIQQLSTRVNSNEHWNLLSTHSHWKNVNMCIGVRTELETAILRL